LTFQEYIYTSCTKLPIWNFLLFLLPPALYFFSINPLRGGGGDRKRQDYYQKLDSKPSPFHLTPPQGPVCMHSCRTKKKKKKKKRATSEPCYPDFAPVCHLPSTIARYTPSPSSSPPSQPHLHYPPPDLHKQAPLTPPSLPIKQPHDPPPLLRPIQPNTSPGS